MSGPEVVTLGCRLNAAEGEAMRAMVGHEDDLVIVNTCAVTTAAARQSAQAARAAVRRRPGARVVVTGCAAQLEPTRFAAIPGVAAVIGNHEKRTGFLATRGARIALAPDGDRAAMHVADIMAARDTAPHLAAGLGTRARAFVEVQNGCDHRCTFCIIPFARGPSRSVPAARVVDTVRALVAQGHDEVVLTGVDTASWAGGTGETLGTLVERVLGDVPALRRLRLSSLDTVEVDDRLFALLAGEPRLQPHLHLSLQAGDDMVLKRMRRRHSRLDAVRLVERLKAARPAIAIGADLIAGFPTESEEQALNSLRLLDDCDIVFAHVFPYSPRRGTPAARMPQVDPVVARARARRLREAGDSRRRAWLATLVGTEQSLLIERTDGRGHTGQFAEARLADGAAGAGAGNAPARGDIVTMRVTHVEGDVLVGPLA